MIFSRNRRLQGFSAFITPYDLYQCMVLRFTLRGFPATFQRLVDDSIQRIPRCWVYVDDIVIDDKSWEEHLVHLKQVSQRLQKANLTMNLSKSEFEKAKVTYFGT